MAEGGKKRPTCLIVLGMAGSGKTTFVQRLTFDLNDRKTAPYVVNMDPACYEVPYPCNIDIRDTVNYKEVMKQYRLGPNGGIVTALNLFATKFDQVLQLVEKRSDEYEYVIFDTPGQIEVFTWSASGTIITEALAAVFPTVVVYVMDIVRSTNPVTFMSNMLYACSILYKAKLPFIVVMNKIDVVDHSFAMSWMKDFDIFQDALRSHTSYSANLASSMSLVLDDFYKVLKAVGVSAVLGTGIDEFLEAVAAGRIEYESDYKQAYESMKREKELADKAKQVEQLKKLKDDMAQKSEPLITSRRATSSDIYMSPGSDDEDTSDEEQLAKVDEEDEEEKKEYQSFKAFLQNQGQKAKTDVSREKT